MSRWGLGPPDDDDLSVVFDDEGPDCPICLVKEQCALLGQPVSDYDEMTMGIQAGFKYGVYVVSRPGGAGYGPALAVGCYPSSDQMLSTLQQSIAKHIMCDSELFYWYFTEYTTTTLH